MVKTFFRLKGGGELLTTRWNLDELAFWLRDFLEHMEEDPYPVEADGEFAAYKDISAREFNVYMIFAIIAVFILDEGDVDKLE